MNPVQPPPQEMACVPLERDDEQLMANVVAGDIRAFETLFARHRRSAHAVAARICGPALAEEAVQDAFLQISRAAGSYEPALGTVRTWVLGIVRLRAIDTRRRDDRHSRRRVDVERLESLADDSELETTVALRDEARTVRELLERLPVEQARAIRMAYFGQLTHQEIARRLGVPLGTVKGRIRLGLLKLREPLDGPVAILSAR
jgi:RNA polymerase sigma-70 factor (ECF subfamily)